MIALSSSLGVPQPYACHVTTDIAFFATRAKMLPAANCRRPRSFNASWRVKRCSFRISNKDWMSSLRRLSVLPIVTKPFCSALTLITTPSAWNISAKSGGLAPDSAKSQPTSLKNMWTHEATALVSSSDARTTKSSKYREGPHMRSLISIDFPVPEMNLKAHMGYQLSPFPSSNAAIALCLRSLRIHIEASTNAMERKVIEQQLQFMEARVQPCTNMSDPSSSAACHLPGIRTHELPSNDDEHRSFCSQDKWQTEERRLFMMMMIGKGHLSGLWESLECTSHAWFTLGLFLTYVSLFGFTTYMLHGVVVVSIWV